MICMNFVESTTMLYGLEIPEPCVSVCHENGLMLGMLNGLSLEESLPLVAVTIMRIRFAKGELDPEDANTKEAIDKLTLFASWAVNYPRAVVQITGSKFGFATADDVIAQDKAKPILQRRTVNIEAALDYLAGIEKHMAAIETRVTKLERDRAERT